MPTLHAYVRRMIKKSPAACQLPGIFFNVQPPLLGRFFAPAFTGRDCVDDAFFAVAGV